MWKVSFFGVFLLKVLPPYHIFSSTVQYSDLNLKVKKQVAKHFMSIRNFVIHHSQCK